MNTHSSRPWWPTTPAAAAALALSLRDRGAAPQLFELCTVAAASQEWDIFAAAMAALGDVSVRSIRNMVEAAKFDSSWGILYGRAAMPAGLFPLLIEVLKAAQRLPPAADEGARHARRLAVMQQALSSPDLRLLDVAADVKAALLA